MRKKIKSIVLVMAAGFAFSNVHAQITANDDFSKDQNIIIHKKDSTKEKITVVIDGNNITINGKPVDDFKSDDVDILTSETGSDGLEAYNNALENYNNENNVMPGGAPVPPTPPQMQSFRENMMRNIKINPAFLGVMTEASDKGAKIKDVTKNSAAEKAGLKEGDIITKVDADVINGPDDLYKSVGKHKPDDKINITYLRNGKQETANVTLSKSQQMQVYSWNSPNAHFDMKGFDPQNFDFSFGDKPRLGIEVQDLEDGNGVKVTNINDDNSAAAKAGLKEGDIITQVKGKTISSVDDLKTSLKDVKKGDTLKITYRRNNQIQTADIKFPKELKTINL